jgi:hypothetical protein
MATRHYGAGYRGMSTPDVGIRTVMLLTLVSLALSPALAAQERSLGQVERLASTGRAEEARVMLLEWWEDERSNASRADVQLGLWLRGRLTVDPGQAARDFRRLVIEYPSGRYADQALFRLAQGAYVQGDLERVRTYMTSLTRDHPGSAVLEQAEAWMGRASTAGPPPVLRVIEAEESEEERRDDAQVATPSQDAAVADNGSQDTAVAGTGSQGAAVVGTGSQGRYTVQLGAFLDESRAGALLERAAEVGLDVRLVRVRGSRLMHVRVGRFDSSAQASVSFQSVTALGFTAAVVRDAQNEEPVSG